MLFWGEPLNSVSNIAFIIASILVYVKYKNIRDIMFFSILIFLIGLSSFLFHTLPNTYTRILDIFSIISYLIFYLYYLNSKILKIHFFKTFLIIFTCISFSILSSIYLKFYYIGDSSFYLPIILLLMGYYFIFKIKKIKSAKLYLIGTIVFIFSLTFRVLDNKYCPLTYIGTHSLWHVLNSVVIVLTLKALNLKSLRTHSPSPKVPT